MSAFFTPCTAPDCPRNTAGYCEKCANPHGLGGELSYSEGFQAGLKKGAEIAQDTGAKFQFGTAGKTVDWYIGVADVMNLVNDVLAEEIISEDAPSSSGSHDN